jgi:hypothetical protein
MERDYTTREEHLEFCKDRALEYLDGPGPPDAMQAINSFLSDLGKHSETANHAAIELIGMHLFSGLIDDRKARDLINGTR